MSGADIISETYSAVTVNKTRSGLTILGIVIGIASVIAMIAIGKGAQNSIQENIQAIGSNLLMVRPGAGGFPGSPVSQGQGSAASLTAEDADALRDGVDSIGAIAPEISGNYQVIAKGKNTRTGVMGTTPEYPAVRNLEVEKGTFFSAQQERTLAKVAVLGAEVSAELFGEENDPIGQKIRIGGADFTVIGVNKAKGGTGFGSSDDTVFVPLTTAKQYLSGDDSLSLISIQIREQSLMTLAEKQIEEILFKRHGIDNPEESDFRIMNQGDIVAAASSVTETFTLLLGAVAGISLVVGGIGIMNMMLTSVTERTREIGLRKALGAKRKDIQTQFLVEAITLTFIGGVIGIGLGYLVSLGMDRWGNLTTEVSPFSVLLAFGVSALIGIVFGFYPARRAAKLNPIEALRYE